ncbi:MAG: YceI family protein [Saprospiraceae bacterium]
MKNCFKVILLLISISLVLSCKNSGQKDKEVIADSSQKYGTLYEVKTDQSIIYWIGKAALTSHNGSVKIKTGSLEIDTYGQIKSGTFKIDMQSISNLDIADVKDKKKLEDHLKSVDFFAVDSFPEADFIITKVQYISDSLGNHLITGDLTIKGKVNEINIKANVISSGNTVMVTVPEFTIDRTLWNINYNSSKILDLIKDKLISDEVKISMKILAARK